MSVEAPRCAYLMFGLGSMHLSGVKPGVGYMSLHATLHVEVIRLYISLYTRYVSYVQMSVEPDSASYRLQDKFLV